MTTVNVNLKACDCATSAGGTHALVRRHQSIHEPTCPGAPILVPLELEPFRSVTFTVRLGECACLADDHPTVPHSPACPARPVRVSCFIDGTDWPSSEVGEIDVHTSSNPLAVDTERLLAACRDRWALVKAMVAGEHPDHDTGRWTGPTLPLFEQRDAVFAALAERARLEAQATACDARLNVVLPRTGIHDLLPQASASAAWIAAYVERLIEQVGILEGGQ